MMFTSTMCRLIFQQVFHNTISSCFFLSHVWYIDYTYIIPSSSSRSHLVVGSLWQTHIPFSLIFKSSPKVAYCSSSLWPATKVIAFRLNVTNEFCSSSKNTSSPIHFRMVCSINFALVHRCLTDYLSQTTTCFFSLSASPPLQPNLTANQFWTALHV